MSQDHTEVNLYGIAARYIGTVVDKKIVGIALQFPYISFIYYCHYAFCCNPIEVDFSTIL